MSQLAAHLTIGRAAEAAACSRLGFRVVLRNVRTQRGELDIVALHDGVPALIEVWYRAS